MIKAIIFDYDGTIADSVDIKTQAFAELYKPYGIDIADKVVKYHLSHGGVSRFDKFKYFHKEFLNIELSEFEIQNLAKKFSKLVIFEVVNAPYITGSLEFITNNYKVFDMFISTATPTDEIHKILKRKNLKKYFIKVLGSPESKSDHVRKIMSENNYSISEVVFIGDSNSDREAANVNSIHFIAVTNSGSINNEKFSINDLNDLDRTILSIDEQEKSNHSLFHNTSN